MPLTTTAHMLAAAKEGRYAVGAFNAENMEMVQAIVQAAQEMNAPVIVQTTPGTLKYAPLQMYYANVAVAAALARVPVAMHLDHGNSFALAAKALRAGYTSVMIDGSHLPLEENIALTQSVVGMCTAAGVSVEGELGRVGGKEDDLESDGCGYTLPHEAQRFVAETRVNSLAVGVGTAHGVYAETPVLNLDLISQLYKLLPVPMVLHGASGLADDTVQACVQRGMCKVNFATELRIAYTGGVAATLQSAPDTIDPKKYGAAGREAVKEFVKQKIQVCGCAGKAAGVW